MFGSVLTVGSLHAGGGGSLPLPPFPGPPLSGWLVPLSSAPPPPVPLHVSAFPEESLHGPHAAFSPFPTHTCVPVMQHVRVLPGGVHDSTPPSLVLPPKFPCPLPFEPPPPSSD